jgi:hypothetical protein
MLGANFLYGVFKPPKKWPENYSFVSKKTQIMPKLCPMILLDQRSQCPTLIRG